MSGGVETGSSAVLITLTSSSTSWALSSSPHPPHESSPFLHLVVQIIIMKFASVVVALMAATVAVAAHSSFEARAATPSVELNDVDVAAINYLASRGLFDETSLEARGLLDKLRGSSSALKITFHDPTGPVSAATQKQITKQLTKFVTKQQQKDFPFCDVNISEGGKVATATFRCFKTAAKKIGDQGPAGALRL